METLFKPFITRFAQPVILSFCIAWIFWNWEIVVGLIWYDKNTLSLYGYANYKELINKNANWQRNYLYPIFVAVIYPYLRYGINYFNTVLETEEVTQTLTASGVGKMSTLKFLKLKKSYDERIAALSTYLEAESQIQNNLNESQTKLFNANKELLEVKDQLEKCKHTELVRNDNSHAEQMSTLAATERTNQISAELKYNRDQLNKFLELSSPNFLISDYSIKITEITNGKINEQETLNGSIVIETDGVHRNNYVLLIEESPMATISSYHYNVVTNTFVVSFNNQNADTDSILNVILNTKLIFNNNTNGHDFQSNFDRENKSYKLELIKQN